MSSPFSPFQKRIFVCYGQVRDCFVPPEGVPVQFDQYLHRHLRGLGYLIGYYGHQGLYFYDQPSHDWIFAGKNSTSAPTGSSRLPGSSPLAAAPGGLSLRRHHQPVSSAPATPAQTQHRCYPNLNRLPEMLPYLRRLIRPGNPDVAIVFDSDHLSDFSTQGPSVDQFRGFLDVDLRRLPADSRTIFIFAFGMEFNQLIPHLQHKPALHLLGPDQNTPQDGLARLIHVGSPDRDEVTRLIHYYRLRHGLGVEWLTLEKNVLQLTALLKGQETGTGRLRTLRDLEHRLRSLVSGSNRLDAAAVRAMTGRAVCTQTALERLEAMIGLDQFKDYIRQKLKSWRFDQAASPARPHDAHPADDILRLADRPPRPAGRNFLHLVLKGNPGVGKTTIARLIGEIYQEAGLLEIGHTLKVGKDGLVAGFVGQTAIKTRECVIQALGGVLFIDEAYNLVTGNETDFGREAINTLIDAMDEHKDNLCVIFAGYPDDMDRLVAANAGFLRRVEVIEIEDYRPEHLAAIFADLGRRAHPPVVCDAELSALLPRFFQEMYDQRTRDFGNAGTVNTLFEAMRKAAQNELDAPADRYILSQCHVPPRFQACLRQIATANRSEPLEELEALAGLTGVKTRIRALIDTMSLEQARQAQGMAREPVRPGHYLFVGNPGTGKTTVARLMGEQFKRMGLLKTGRVVEVTASQLAGQAYIGHAEKAVQDRVAEALGGILFIDEAHQLAQPHGFGQNALTALTPLLTNHAHELTVICAGYTLQMQGLFALDPGLKRRFEIIEFADLTADELVMAFHRFVGQAGFVCSPETRPALEGLLHWMVAHRTPTFGNAGTAGTVFDRARHRLAQRIRTAGITHSEAINTLLAQDIPKPDDCGDLL